MPNDSLNEDQRVATTKFLRSILESYKQTEVSKATGLRQSTISEVAAEKRSPTMRIAYELARFRKVTVDEVLGMGPRPLGKTLAEIPGYKDAEFLLRKDDFIAWPAELWLQLRDSIVVIEMKRVTPQSLHFIAHGIELSMEADE